MSWDPWPRPVTRVAVGAKECTQIGENGPSELFWGICVHCCAVADRRGDAEVYTNRRKQPLGAVLGHLCTLLRRELRRELRRVARAPQPPWRAGGAPSVAASPLVGKTGPARAVPPLAWRLRRGSNPHEPPKSHKVQAVPAPLAPQGADIGACGAQGYRKCSSTATKCITHLSCDYSGSLGRTGHSRCYLSLLRESLSRSLRPCSLPASLLRVRGSFMGAARTWRHIGSLGCQARGIDVVGALRHFGLDVMCHIPQ